MRKNNILEAKAEAKRFLGRVGELEAAMQREWPNDTPSYTSGLLPRECGAVRRASLDLTRALAKMRLPEGSVADRRTASHS